MTGKEAHLTLKAVIFDFNGIIIDDEPLHSELLRKVLEEEAILLSEDDYLEFYLGFDDRACFIEALCNNSRTPDAADDLFIDELVERKSQYYKEAIQSRLSLFPGVVEIIRKTAADYPLAIASGALREEIELVLQEAGIRDEFVTIISSEDVSECKPNPEGFLRALEGINATTGLGIDASECLVIEDSLPGVEAARAAGMKCLAVTNSLKREILQGADEIVSTMENVNLKEVFEEIVSRKRAGN